MNETVAVRDAPSPSTVWMMSSTTTPPDARRANSPATTPGRSGSPLSVTRPRSPLSVTPVTRIFSTSASSAEQMSVPGPSRWLCSTRIGTPNLAPNCTARGWSTVAPSAAISSIAS